MQGTIAQAEFLAVLKQVAAVAPKTGEGSVIRLQSLPSGMLEVYWFGWTTEAAWQVPWTATGEDPIHVVVNVARLLTTVQALDGPTLTLIVETDEMGTPSAFRIRGKKRRGTVPIEAHPMLGHSTGFQFAAPEGEAIELPDLPWRDLGWQILWALRTEAEGGPPALQHVLLHRSLAGQWEWVASNGQWVIWRTWDVGVPEDFPSVVCPVGYLRILSTVSGPVTWIQTSKIGVVRSAGFESRTRWVDAPYPDVQRFASVDPVSTWTWDAEAWTETLQDIMPMAKFGDAATLTLTITPEGSYWDGGDGTTQVQAELSVQGASAVGPIAFPARPLQALSKLVAGSPTLTAVQGSEAMRGIFQWHGEDSTWKIVGMPYAR